MAMTEMLAIPPNNCNRGRDYSDDEYAGNLPELCSVLVTTPQERKILLFFLSLWLGLVCADEVTTICHFKHHVLNVAFFSSVQYAQAFWRKYAATETTNEAWTTTKYFVLPLDFWFWLRSNLLRWISLRSTQCSVEQRQKQTENEWYESEIAGKQKSTHYELVYIMRLFRCDRGCGQRQAQ